jgi:hypothetical protein
MKRSVESFSSIVGLGGVDLYVFCSCLFLILVGLVDVLVELHRSRSRPLDSRS